MKGLYRFNWDCGRMGEVEGVFVATSDAINRIQGEYVRFGEILGKHSEIEGEIEAGDFKLLSDEPQVIYIFENYVGSVGYNPFDYIDEEEGEEESYPDEIPF